MAARLRDLVYVLDNLNDRIQAFRLALNYRIVVADSEEIVANLRAEIGEMQANVNALTAESDALFRDLPIAELLQTYRENGGFYPILNGIRRWRLEPIWQSTAIHMGGEQAELSIPELKKLKADVDEWLLTVRGEGYHYLQQLFPTAQMEGYSRTLGDMLYKKTTERTLALMMGTHSRLGPHILRNLDVHLLRDINEEAMK
jgi:hypothetical protein